jgi:glycosyltransferase involved in cell wall biosynthesis
MVDVRERYRRRQVLLPFGAGVSPKPTIYFLTPDHDVPSGGIRVIYRHVDLLNAAGIAAFVLHRAPGFRCSWFEHETKVTDFDSAVIRRGDLLVVSELDVDLLAQLPPAIRYVVFNQNSHLTWKRAPDDMVRLYSSHPGLAGVVTVSSHNREMLACAFRGSPVQRVHLGIDPALFHPGKGARVPRIGYMPRRGRADARQVLHILRGRGVLEGWEVVPFDGLSHSEVAEQLRTTRIFLAFTHQEGFGLPAAEAMACGNYVIGNHGFAGREFFRPAFSAPVEAGDVMGFVRAVEETITKEREAPGWCEDRGAAASRFILDEYAPAREQHDVARIYTEFLGVKAAAPTYW